MNEQAMFAGTYAYWGPPGTGKTTTLAKQANEVVKRTEVRTDNTSPVVICSLTRAAAEEIASPKRGINIPRWQIGTLHAHAYRMLGSPEIAETHIDEWNEREKNLSLDKGSGEVDPDDFITSGDWIASQSTEGAQLAAEYNLLRTKMIPRDRWKYDVRRFAQRWEAWKKDNEYIDFTDMIELALKECDHAPGNPDVVIIDEAQDHGACELALCKKWGESAGQLILAGDPWQCQPPGTMVETSFHGQVAIENLNPQKHGLITFERRSSSVKGRRNPYSFSIASRKYSGSMFDLSIDDGKKVSSTPEHRWTIKVDRTHSMNLHALYLMQKGNRWRVGHCKLFWAPNHDAGAFGPSMRVRQEKADRVWILKLYNDTAEVQGWEEIISCLYRIPKSCFEVHSNGLRTDSVINLIFEKVGHLSDPSACLEYFGRDMRFPFWENVNVRKTKGERIGVRTPLTVRACNLFPEVMKIPVTLGGKRFEWRWFTLTSRPYDGIVYSLKVDRHEHYIANGVITHNSIYVWRGADPSFMLNLPKDRMKILSQSYRVPLRVRDISLKWMRMYLSNYRDLKYEPRDYEGTIGRVHAGHDNPEEMLKPILKDAEAGKSVIILATCGYMLKALVAVMRQRGIPFSNPWRRKRGDWNPIRGGRGISMRDRIMAFLRMDNQTFSLTSELKGDRARMWTGEELAQWASILPSRVIVKHGAKRFLVRLSREKRYEGVSEDDLKAVFVDDALLILRSLFSPTDQSRGGQTARLLEWFSAFVLESKKKALEYPLSVLKHYGVKGLTTEPGIHIGTIHSFKGAEGDCVYICPDLSPAGEREWQSGRGPARDAVVRCFYVAMTRAREKLVFCDPVTSYAVQF